MNGSVVVITGASRGLGAAMAERLAGEKCQLAQIDLDVVGPMQNAAGDFGALHALINNAGITRDTLTLKYKDGKLVSEMSLDQWQAVIDVNLTGAFSVDAKRQYI